MSHHNNDHHHPFSYDLPPSSAPSRAHYAEHYPSHPPSRLSPPPGASIAVSHPVASGSSDRHGSIDQASSLGKRKDDSGPKRGYRACVHCRMRKARCDLGDVNAPSSPPCSRCRREQRTCVFVPSKRRKKRTDDLEEGAEAYPAPGSANGHHFPATIPPPQRQGSEEWSTKPFNLQTITRPPMASGNSASSIPAPFGHNNNNNNNWSDSLLSQINTGGPSTGSLATPHSASLHHSYLEPAALAEPSSIGHSNTTPASIPESAGSGSALSPNAFSRLKKKRQHSPDATRRIVAANFSNEIDALEILANAAADGDSEEDEQNKTQANEDSKKGIRWDLQEDHPQEKGIEEYCLVKAGVLTVGDLENLIRLFFENHHPVLPIFQTSRIPKTIPQLAALSVSDPFLLSTMILVASRHHSDPRMKAVHEKAWDIVRDALADYSFSGLPASIGFVEGVLLLAEFLPREQSGKPMSSQLLSAAPSSTMEGMENRRSWALTGLAIRAAYGIGLDQIALEVSAVRTPEVERARSAWTWCYLYDRTIDESSPFTGEAAARENFPYMLSPGEPGDPPTGDDSASLMQALIELTQIMTNAHDILYPSKGRTSALVAQGTYFKYCDHFRKALDTYAEVWTDKKWKNPALRELASCTYHFVRLYVSSFAFQAHVQRAQMRAEAERTNDKQPSVAGTQLFPRGSATSPDALYIYDSIDAANEILQICMRLGALGVLQNLPSRYLINFVYGGVFALKAGYSGATSTKDMVQTKELVDHVCATLVLSSRDRDHPACRYGGMLRMLAKKLEQLSDASAVPSRFPSPEPHIANPLADGQTAMGFGQSAADSQAQLADLQMADFGGGGGGSGSGSGSGLLTVPGAGPGGVGADAEKLFDFDVEGVNFNLDGFWDDFSLLGEGSGFPFK